VKLYTYRLDHDLGFAPNPFYGYCTLACCKTVTRRVARVGDFVAGMAGKGGLKSHYKHLIFWMQVSEDMSFTDYWNDPRFSSKRPIVGAYKQKAVGDNTYRKDNGVWKQEASMHFIPSRPKTYGNIDIDTKTDRILLGENFTYWGDKAPLLSEQHYNMFPIRNHKLEHSDEEKQSFFDQYINNGGQGLIGDPIDWKNPKFFP